LPSTVLEFFRTIYALQKNNRKQAIPIEKCISVDAKYHQ
jgi:hypothetical protein